MEKAKNPRAEFNRSPFFYVGDKFKLLPQLKENFPKENLIETKRKPHPSGGGKRESSYAITQQPCSAAWPGEPSCDWRRSCG